MKKHIIILLLSIGLAIFLGVELTKFMESVFGSAGSLFLPWAIVLSVACWVVGLGLIVSPEIRSIGLAILLGVGLTKLLEWIFGSAGDLFVIFVIVFSSFFVIAIFEIRKSMGNCERMRNLKIKTIYEKTINETSG